MRAPLKTVLSISVLAMAGAWTTQAAAADPGLCRDYAHTAEHQVRAAHEDMRCERAVAENPARWTGDYDAHYSWCLGAKTKDVERERNARRATLEHCLPDRRW
jgi:hypothetical protein